MRHNVKQWVCLLAATPALAMAQAQQGCASDQKAAVKDLLDAIDANKLVQAIGEGAQAQSKQLVPQILERQLVQNKTLTDAQKQAVVPILQKNAVQKLADSAGHVFTTDSFKNDAIQAQYNAYCKNYSTQEIKDLTTFYRSPTGQKYIKVQDQVGQEVVGGLMQKYMPQSIKATSDQADAEIASAARQAPKGKAGK